MKRQTQTITMSVDDDVREFLEMDGREERNADAAIGDEETEDEENECDDD